MDKLQESRYWAIYGAYKAVDPLVNEVIRRKISENLSQTKHLRADGAVFLLVNFDQMIGSLNILPADGSSSKEKPLTSGMLERAFDIIMTNLQSQALDDRLGYSSHKVIKSIDDTWDELSRIFAWA